MRLWHYELIPALPNAMLVSQWRECIAIKRQWEKSTLKHRLVSYVMNYEKSYFERYVLQVINELENRNISYKIDLLIEIIRWCNCNGGVWGHYPEHNGRYFKQCYHNLEEKHDRGIISDDEWSKINQVYYDIANNK